MPNLAAPTLGGKQLWRDVWWREGWRVQEHAWTGHHRLLDTAENRRGWGAKSFCIERAEAQAPSERDSHLVVLLHGLGRSRASLDKLATEFSSQGYRVCSLTYPSTRASVDEHVEGIREVLARLDEVEQVSFVTHSLGGLVARELACEENHWEVERMVMLAPPNRGSELGRRLDWNPAVRILLGPALADIERAPELGVPDAEIGVIAAARGHRFGWNPLVRGDDDGVVGVEETKLDVPHTHHVVRGLHTFLMRDDDVIEKVARFLASGSFDS